MKIFTFLLCLMAAPVTAAELVFRDQTPFANFTVQQLNPDGTRTRAFFAGTDQFFATEGWAEGELRKFVVDFTIPTSEDFKIADAKPMSLAIDVVATPEIIEQGFTIPVHFLTCKATCGFKGLEGFSRRKPDSIFKSYFLAAELAEYYRVTYPDERTAQGKRAVRIWRDAAYSLCLLGENWFSFPAELIAASEFAFGPDSKAHIATVSYADRITQGKCR